MDKSRPSVPKGTRAAGRRLWSSVVDEFDLDEHELALLREATRLVDRLDALDAVVAEEGVIVDSVNGTRAHPALVESRQQALVLSRVLAALRLPSGDEDAGRPQRRVGVRRPYSVGGGTARPRRVS